MLPMLFLSTSRVNYGGKLFEETSNQLSPSDSSPLAQLNNYLSNLLFTQLELLNKNTAFILA
jgi:hypothetical protein